MEGEKEYLEVDSQAAKELKKILLDPEWLKSLEVYVFFRYSSYLVQYLLLCDCGDHYTDSILTQFFSLFLIVIVPFQQENQLPELPIWLVQNQPFLSFWIFHNHMDVLFRWAINFFSVDLLIIQNGSI